MLLNIHVYKKITNKYSKKYVILYHIKWKMSGSIRKTMLNFPNRSFIYENDNVVFYVYQNNPVNKNKMKD